MSPASAQPVPQPATEMPYSEAEYAAIMEQLITEDDEPVDNILSAKQQRLLTETLYNSWDGGGHKFLAEANVGLFHVMRNPAIVPDMLLSLDVEVRQDWWDKTQRSYFVWEFGKPPDVVVEIVSNTVGGEQTEKKRKYALMRVLYYLVFDPQHHLSAETLTIYRLDGLSYRRQDSLYLTEVKLGVALWEGVYEDVAGTWLRWTNEHGLLLPCGKELVEYERVEKETALAERETAQARAEQLAAQLRALGIDPVA
ncbi:MAG: Uma2 family endonuclease [Acidobacteria bacterium]|nr:Uma2 family endonuclease [Acidobacteriota bacterium]MBI3424889.1 Uma2 family endonuclease [Acidobacteriota bacterium]